MVDLKELLIPKTFNNLSFAIVICWVVVGGILCGIFGEIENNESRFDFRCDAAKGDRDKDFIRGKCFDEYQKQYNKLGIPLYGFVIVNFSVILIVSVVYSLCVKSTVNGLERDRDAEGEHPRRLFIAYLCQLAVRFALGILFIVLQTQLFYPSKFPSDFKCDLTDDSNNSTDLFSDMSTQSTIYECNNQRARKKSFWTDAVAVVNGIFAFFLLVEIGWILSRAREGNEFMENRQFYAHHLKSNLDEQHETTPERMPSGSQETVPLEPQSVEESQLDKEPETTPERMPSGRQETVPPLPGFVEEPKPDETIQEGIPLLHQELTQAQAELQQAIKRMKDDCLTNTEGPDDLKQPFPSNPGEGAGPRDLKMDEIYVNAVIHEGRASHKFTTQRRREQLRQYPPEAKHCHYARPDDLIDKEHKNILVVGRPGIGKTLLSTKLHRKWASGEAFKGHQEVKAQFDVVFLVKFRRFKDTGPLSLRELLNRAESVNCFDDKIWDFMIKTPKKVLLIFDGLDEFSSRDDIRKDHSDYKDDEDEKMPVSVLFEKLASGKLLRGASIITTTRPTAVKCVRRVTFDRVVELLGFTSENVEDYVGKFTKGVRGAKTKIWKHIKSNMNLFSLCYIPVNCFIICHCLLQILIDGVTDTAQTLPTKITEIYTMTVKITFFNHNRQRRPEEELGTYMYTKFSDLPTEDQQVFTRLGQIAFTGIKEQRLLFESSEVNGLEDCGLLHKLPDVTSRSPLTEPPKAQYCFTHLTVQEFLAAKHLTDSMNKREIQTFVREHIKDGAWEVVLQFVAGLLEPDSELQNSSSDIFIELLPMSTEEREETELTEDFEVLGPRTLTCWPAREDKQLALNLCKCLYEIPGEKQQSLLRNKIEKIGFSAVDFSDCSLAPVDCAAVTHFLQNAKGVLCMDLSFNNIGSLGCKEVENFIVTSDSKLNSLNLSFNNIKDQGAKHLAETLKDNNCKLESLNLTANNITDKGLEHFAEEALTHNNCKLNSLNLSISNITYQGAKYLANALEHNNSKLNRLNLEDNNIGDSGAWILASALNGCELNSLNLMRNNIKDEGAVHLAEALEFNYQLNSLNLSFNNIKDKGAEHLAEALKHNRWKVHVISLNLENNDVTHKCAKRLAEALKHSDCVVFF